MCHHDLLSFDLSASPLIVQILTMDKHERASSSTRTRGYPFIQDHDGADSASCIMPVFALYVGGMKSAGLFLIILGAGVVLIGSALFFGFNLSWLGKLPGDIRIIRVGYSFYFPITTCIVLSVVISLILYLIKIFR
jgi:hypothetical protein